MFGFSDGSPPYEVAVVVATFAIAAILASYPIASCRLDRLLTRLAAGVRRRGLFHVGGLEREQRRIDLVRIATGLVACILTLVRLNSAHATGDSVSLALHGMSLGLLTCVTIGLGTPVAAGLSALLGNLVIDNYGLTSSLVGMVQAILMAALAAFPAGRRLSVDALMLRHAGPIRRLYDVWGPLTVDRSTLVRLVAFTSFAAISLHAVLLHLLAPPWRAGAVLAWVFLTPAMNPIAADLAVRTYEHAPMAFAAFTIAATYGILLWELSMVPLAAVGAWGRRFVALWWLAFSITSAGVLYLRWLGLFELILGVLLFSPRR